MQCIGSRGRVSDILRHLPFGTRMAALCFVSLVLACRGEIPTRPETATRPVLDPTLVQRLQHERFSGTVTTLVNRRTGEAQSVVQRSGDHLGTRMFAAASGLRAVRAPTGPARFDLSPSSLLFTVVPGGGK